VIEVWDDEREGMSRFGHKSPVVPPRSLKSPSPLDSRRPPPSATSSTANMNTTAATTTMTCPGREVKAYGYVLMHDRRGYKGGRGDTSGSRHGPAVTVEKGTLVEIAPEALSGGGFNPSTSVSVTVASLDRPDVRVQLLFKVKPTLPQVVFFVSQLGQPQRRLSLGQDLLVIEGGVFQLLLPLIPSQRYDLLTQPQRQSVLSVAVGDLVYCVTKAGYKEPGMVQYLGPVKGLGHGHFVGVELLVRRGCFIIIGKRSSLSASTTIVGTSRGQP
jgi:hypothetical protein